MSANTLTGEKYVRTEQFETACITSYGHRLVNCCCSFVVSVLNTASVTSVCVIWLSPYTGEN